MDVRYTADGEIVLIHDSSTGNLSPVDILSEQGMPLTVEAPREGYELIMGDKCKLSMTENVITVNAEKNETVIVRKKDKLMWNFFAKVFDCDFVL